MGRRGRIDLPVQLPPHYLYRLTKCAMMMQHHRHSPSNLCTAGIIPLPPNRSSGTVQNGSTKGASCRCRGHVGSYMYAPVQFTFNRVTYAADRNTIAIVLWWNFNSGLAIFVATIWTLGRIGWYGATAFETFKVCHFILLWVIAGELELAFYSQTGVRELSPKPTRGFRTRLCYDFIQSFNNLSQFFLR